MIYIDLGAYNGGTIRKFIASKHYSPEARIFAWECNPHLQNVNYGLDVEKVPAAAWIEDGSLTFYLSKFNPAKVQGSSFDKTKRTGKLDTAHPVQVPCINFSNWLSELVNPKIDINGTTEEPESFGTIDIYEKPKVIVKMNIEGAEYPLLDFLLKEGTISLIDTLIVKWHWNRISSYSREYHNELKSRLREVESLELIQTYDWYNE